MKKLSPLLLLLLFAPFSVSAQSAERTLISSTGGSFNNASFSADYSVGELMVMTFSTPSLVLTQGFQQPPHPETPVIEPEHPLDILVYPNPGAGMFHLVTGPGFSGPLELQVYDMLGQLVLSRSYSANGQALSLDIDLGPMATGTYHLRLSHSGGVIGVPLVKVSR
jgi:hypothetical protein